LQLTNLLNTDLSEAFRALFSFISNHCCSL